MKDCYDTSVLFLRPDHKKLLNINPLLTATCGLILNPSRERLHLDYPTLSSDPRRFQISGSHLPVSEFVSAIIAGFFHLPFDRSQLLCVLFLAVVEIIR
jgi:hypothetical protein